MDRSFDSEEYTNTKYINTINTTKEADITTKIVPIENRVVEYTENRVECRTMCEKYGEAFYWCYQIGGSWDYCIPVKK